MSEIFKKIRSRIVTPLGTPEPEPIRAEEVNLFEQECGRQESSGPSERDGIRILHGDEIHEHFRRTTTEAAKAALQAEIQIRAQREGL